jgi:hypothetical protein
MTTQEVMTIRKYAEGAFPQLKSNDGSDMVWVDLLAPFGYLGIMKVLREYILMGNKFPPTVGELISKYQTVLPPIEEAIVQLMLEHGEFDDSNGDDDIRLWNRQKRLANMREWISRDYIPESIKSVYEHYKAMAGKRYFAPQQQIERGK